MTERVSTPTLFSPNDPVAVCHRLDQKGWVANHDGNLSVRVVDSGAPRQNDETARFLATPTARAKGSLTAGDLIEVNLDGKTLLGTGKIFSEWAFHREVYVTRPEAHAVVHAHSPFAMATGIAGLEISTAAIPEAVVSLGGGVPLVGLGLPTSSEVLTGFAELIPHYDAVLVAGNGVFAWGPNLELAYLRLELVEHVARCLMESLRLGGPHELSDHDRRECLKKRASAGLSRPSDPRRPHWFLDGSGR